MRKIISTLVVLFTSFYAFTQSVDGLIANYKFENNLQAANDLNLQGTSSGTSFTVNNNRTTLSVTNSLATNQCNGTWVSQCLRYSKGSCIAYQQVCNGTLVSAPATQNYVKLSNTLQSTITNQVTVSFWAYALPNNGFPWNILFSKRLNKSYNGSTLYNSINLALYSNGTLDCAITTDANTEVRVSKTNFTYNQWQHIALTYDGDSSKLYLDGILIDKKALTGNITFDSQYDWVLGQISQTDFSQGGNFYMDDLFIFSKALTASEIVNLKNTNLITEIAVNPQVETSIYPNPANQIVHSAAYCEIFNLMGEKVAEGKENINIEHLSNGVYLVKQGNTTTKLVKE